MRCKKINIPPIPLIIGYVLTTVVTVIAFLTFCQTEMYEKGGNEIGDFLSGFMGSLAIIWAVLAVYIQSNELKLQRQEFEELRKATEEQAKSVSISSVVHASEYFDKQLAKVKNEVKLYHDNIVEITKSLEDRIDSVISSGSITKPYFYWLDVLGAFVDKTETNPKSIPAKYFNIRSDFGQPDYVKLQDLAYNTYRICQAINETNDLKKRLGIFAYDMEFNYQLDTHIFQNFDDLALFTKQFSEHARDTLIERYRDSDNQNDFNPMFIETLKVFHSNDTVEKTDIDLQEMKSGH